MAVRINNIEIKNKSWMQVVINKEDGYIISGAGGYELAWIF
ncbi:MAG: hypothetical protein ACRCV0_00925 [Brevinema sp.]